MKEKKKEGRKEGKKEGEEGEREEGWMDLCMEAAETI